MRKGRERRTHFVSCSVQASIGSRSGCSQDRCRRGVWLRRGSRSCRINRLVSGFDVANIFSLSLFCYVQVLDRRALRVLGCRDKGSNLPKRIVASQSA